MNLTNVTVWERSQTRKNTHMTVGIWGSKPGVPTPYFRIKTVINLGKEGRMAIGEGHEGYFQVSVMLSFLTGCSSSGFSIYDNVPSYTFMFCALLCMYTQNCQVIFKRKISVNNSHGIWWRKNTDGLCLGNTALNLAGIYSHGSHPFAAPDTPAIPHALAILRPFTSACWGLGSCHHCQLKAPQTIPVHSQRNTHLENDWSTLLCSQCRDPGSFWRQEALTPFWCPPHQATSVLIWKCPNSTEEHFQCVRHSQSLATFKCVHYLISGLVASFPINPNRTKPLSDGKVQDKFYSTFIQSDSLQMQVLE